MEMLNAVLPELDFNSFLDIGSHQPSPKAIALLPSVAASTFEQAVDFAIAQTQQVFDIIGLNRRAAPRLIAAAVGIRQPSGTVTTVSGKSLLPGYSGNLIGGAFSGEDPHHLQKQWMSTLNDPRVSLWLRLHNEGSSDSRWDYQVFRAFNLLEGIAQELFARATPVVDEQGRPRLQSNQSPYTAAQARGAVALVLGRSMAPTPSATGAAFPSRPLSGDAIPAEFWDQLGLWVAVRNRVAHAGSWSYPRGATPKANLFAFDVQLRRPGAIPELVRATRDTVEHVLRAALEGRLWTSPRGG
jgi:hypothetical protein